MERNAASAGSRGKGKRLIADLPEARAAAAWRFWAGEGPAGWREDDARA